jgi:hypothetical protein
MKRNLSKIVAGIILVITGLGLGLKGCHFPQSFWPIEPTDVEHPIGNSGGEFQQYGGSPYFHEGIDIMDDVPAPSGPFVRTTRAGTVNLALVSAASLYNGLTVTHGDANNSFYKYWHLDFNSVRQAVRDAWTASTVLPANSRVARLVDWTACDYHHLHYETCDDMGCEDPVWDLSPRDDSNTPSIVGVSFTDNGSSTVFPPGFPSTIVNGQVDIIARAFDRQFVTSTQNHKTGILWIRYRVISSGGTTVKTGSKIDFTKIPPDSKVTVLYRNAAPFDSDSSYCGDENYYYVVTNVDDDDASNFSESFAWDTTVHPNGTYQVQVQVWDSVLNTSALSKFVRIAN